MGSHRGGSWSCSTRPRSCCSGFDKRRARRGGRRISERALLTSALISGTIGAWAAMSLFRHKTRKRSFIARMVAVTALDAALLIALVVL